MLWPTAAPERNSAPVQGSPSSSSEARLSSDPAQPFLSAPAPSSSSLRGSELDGALRVGSDGHLVVEYAVRRLFDYLLVQSGEKSPREIREGLVAVAGALSEPARSEAVTLFDRYTAYRQKVAALEATLTPGDLETRLQRLHTLRVDELSAAAEPFFGEEERNDAVAISRMRMGEKSAAALEAELPPPLREARERTVAPLALRQDSVGLEGPALRQLRMDRVGPAATQRLEALDRSRNALRTRVAQYREERLRIEALEKDPSARKAALQELELQRFTPTERLRLPSLNP